MNTAAGYDPARLSRGIALTEDSPFTRSGMISASELTQSLQQRIDEVLKPLLTKGEPVALLDFPNYANVGDSAIWLGEKAILQKLGVNVGHACEMGTYSREGLTKKIKSGAILIQGGGNFGDLWPKHQAFREKVITDFPQHKIIQLPQSIYFKDVESLKRTRTIVNNHSNFVLLVRDRNSFTLARNEFNCECYLCPDMAFGLGALNRINAPDCDILCLSRTDVESTGRIASNLGGDIDCERVDWLNEAPSFFRYLYEKLSGLKVEFPNRFCAMDGFFIGLTIGWRRGGCNVA